MQIPTLIFGFILGLAVGAASVCHIMRDRDLDDDFDPATED